MTPRFETYRDEIVGEIVEYWNRAFAGMRNFWPITEEVFRRRVTEKRTAVEAFEPHGFIVARAGGRIVGLAHAGIHPEAVCRAAWDDWPGGDQGYLALLHVDPAWRRRGIGTELWHRARAAVERAARFAVDTACLNPFYGNSEGPITPFWGTPEGIGMPWEDAQTRSFLARRGYAPRVKAVQLEWRPGRHAGIDARAELGRAGLTLEFREDRIPVVGQPLDGPSRCGREYEYECALAISEGVVRGMVVTYPMREAGDGVWGIYEMEVERERRGRGIGRALVAAAMERVLARGGRRCDVVTIPQLSPGAQRVYESIGFAPVCEWIVC
jgi:GNAT superfamily N-acetyltransferase